MAYIDFISILHTKTKREYIPRIAEVDKAACATVAKKFGKDYWDGERKYGYGGYHYDGRWRGVAENIAKHYKLQPGQRVLDIGCGKAFLLYELTQVVPGLEIVGIDISQYALDHAKEEIRPFLRYGSAQELSYPDNYFDLVLAVNVLHNLPVFELKKAVKEINRVTRENSYIVAESYRNEQEKVNLFCWQLTCEAFFTPDEWQWLLAEWGYTGDHSLVYFE